MGDYDINLLNYDVHNNTTEFTDMMYANSFIPLLHTQIESPSHLLH